MVDLAGKPVLGLTRLLSRRIEFLHADGGVVRVLGDEGGLLLPELPQNWVRCLVPMALALTSSKSCWISSSSRLISSKTS